MIQSKKIDRYNDDFYLNWDGTQTGSNLFDNSNIAKANDWSISFFDIRDNNGTGASFKQSILGNKIGVASGLSVTSKVSSGSYALEVSVFDGSETIYTLLSNISIDAITRIYNVVLSYETDTSTLSFYLNGLFYDSVSLSARAEWSNTSFVKIGSLGDTSSFNKIGGVRDLVFYDRIPTIQEIQYAYKKSVQSVSIYGNILNYYPLNQVPYESGGNYFMRDVANLYNTTATVNDVQLIGWTDVELGLGVGGLPASTTYRGWESKTNYIPSGDYTKGLNFTRSKAQYLEITGLESFNNDDGYTFLIGAEKTGIDPSTQQSFFGCLADEGFTTWYDIFRRGGSGNENEIQFAFPTQLNTTVTLSSISLPNTIDVLQKNLLSFFVSDDKYVNPYNSTPINSIIDVNEQQDFTSGFFQSNNPLGKGFDELTNPKFQLGARNASNTLNGKISLFCIIKGAITKEEEKKIYNNGLFRSPFEVLEDTSKIMIDVDLVNPFLDTDVKFTDNSGNCVITAKGTDWNTLAGVQASID